MIITLFKKYKLIQNNYQLSRKKHLNYFDQIYMKYYTIIYISNELQQATYPRTKQK